ncbi:hypothetical protein RI129_002085 [Pyrocoelia pectoralis]|uniref:Uncharacterized protein n=1 Tax=Pyrocoelia pectoralis TaxID=417401 RepID=A0AAN7VLN8_9COLE
MRGLILLHIILLLLIKFSIPQFSLLLNKAHLVLPDCISSTGVDPQLVKKSTEGLESIDDPSYKCFVKCVFVKLKFMTDDGDIVEDNIMADKLQVSLYNCKGVKANDTCETAFQLIQCFTNYSV